jgi:two-component system sensor histidine kinase FlrB
MGKMTAEIAHQLRTPLATATLYASHLSRENLSKENQRQFASKLSQQLAWLDDLVSRMMRFLSERPAQAEVVSVYSFLNDLKHSIDALFESAAVSLDFHIEGGDHLLTIQRDQVRSGIVSVLENARGSWWTDSRSEQSYWWRSFSYRSSGAGTVIACIE